MSCMNDYIVASGGGLRRLEHDHRLISIDIFVDHIWIFFPHKHSDVYVYIWKDRVSINMVSACVCYNIPMDISVSGKLFFGDIYDLRKIDEQMVIDKVDFLLKNKAFW